MPDLADFLFCGLVKNRISRKLIALLLNYVCFCQPFLELSQATSMLGSIGPLRCGCAAPNCCTAPTYGLIPVQPPAPSSCLPSKPGRPPFVDLCILLHDSDLIDNLSGLSANLVTKQQESGFFYLLFLLDDRRIGIRSRIWICTSDKQIRIREAQKHTDPYPYPQHC
jgi:hypothetical protein